ncbi:MAG: ABC transporter permease [Anaerolineae bacterium]|jgi:ABC-2 type transport system permease protein
MNAWHIARKDLQIFLKDRGSLLILFLMPLLFILVLSGALTGIGAEEADTRIPLRVVDLDGGEAAQMLLDGIDRAGGVRVEMMEEGAAMAQVEENEIPRVLVILAGFTSGFEANRQVTLRLISHPDASSEETEAVQLVIDGVASDMSLESQLIASLRQMGEMQAASAPEQPAFTTERIVGQARSQFERSRTQPLVALVERLPGQVVERRAEAEDMERFAVPSLTVLFVFLTAQTAAQSIYDEKKVGSFRRLLAAPISKASLLIGKMLPAFLMALVQTAVTFTFGIFGLRLLGLTPLELGPSPLGVLLVAVVLALCTSGFGILIAAIARTENQIGGLSNVLVWVMGILGGGIVPLFLLESFLGPVPRIVPHYWAIRAYNDLMIRGLGLADVTTEIAVLLGFTALFFAIGLWRFEYD